MTVELKTGTTPVIDFHVHVFPEAVAPRVVSAFMRFPIEVFTDATLPAWLKHMEESGVDKSVMLSVPTKPAQVKSVNDYLRPMLSNERLIPFAGVHPEGDDPVGVVRRAAEEGFLGIKLHPLMQDFKPQEKRLFPLYDAAISEGLIILMHAGAGMDFDAIRGSKQDFDELFEQYDYDRFVLAHLGGRPDFQSFPEFKTGWPGYLDLAFCFGFMPDDYLIDLVRDFGVDRVVYGTDGPWQSERRTLDYLLGMDFTDDEKRALLFGNAARLLGL